MQQKRARLAIHHLGRNHRQDVLEKLDQAKEMVKTDHSTTGAIIIIVDHHSNARLATAGRLADPAQAVYHAARALGFDLIKRKPG